MMFQYLLDVDKYLALSTSVLQVLVKERQETQQYWQNENKTPDPLKVGDIVKSHVQVNYNSKKGIVFKLSDQELDKFQMIKD